jgi:hypothetical protein
MTITRSFYQVAALSLLALLAMVDTVFAQQQEPTPAVVAPATMAIGSSSALPLRSINADARALPARPGKPRGQGASAASKPSHNRTAKAPPTMDSRDGVNRYPSSQRNLIGQYQNAVTPPPVSGAQ